MSHTYTSCYKVTVPPLDSFHSSRRDGVRLRTDCEPLSSLRDFHVLYLPHQLMAEVAEERAIAAGGVVPGAHAPGWKMSPQEARAAQLAQQRQRQQQALSGAEAASTLQLSDQLLNGPNKGRHAIQHQFHSVRSATGEKMFALSAQRGLQASSVDPSVTAALQLETGLPSWIRMEPHGTMMPRSTTQATHRAAFSDSTTLDQRYFHSYYDEPEPQSLLLPSPPRTAPQSRSASHSTEAALAAARTAFSATERLKRVPLLSSAQPSLMFHIPDEKPFRQMYRNSPLLRAESRQRALEAEKTEKAAATAAAAVAATTARGATERVRCSSASRSSPHHAHAHGARHSSSTPPPQSHASHVSVPGSATPTPTGWFAATMPAPSTASRMETPPPQSAFQAHMQQARQRWAQQQADQQQPRSLRAYG